MEDDISNLLEILLEMVSNQEYFGEVFENAYFQNKWDLYEE